ncbi:ParA family protein [Variovorax sp. VaC1]|uniref:ParA family protein n=1 Tax=Variovorax sp. VaC1 TaxID=3373132 RepID=UPI0037492BA0
MKIRFDDSFPKLIEVLKEELGPVVGGVVIRDIGGRLAFVSAEKTSAKISKKVTAKLKLELGAYARVDRVFASVGDFGVDSILNEKSALAVDVLNCNIRFIDRRLVGADWLRTPAPKASPPARFVFASLKGGVGRSTALSIAAAYLAAKGKRVLAVDLDMEAPGLGSLLLDENTLPEFGLIDALVENGLGPLDSEFLADLIGPSNLADNNGRIDVMPAFGRRSIKNPGDVLSKISRAYIDDIGPDGRPSTVLDQISKIVDQFAKPDRYDAILIDARAGLHETTATAILGLGAEVFLFGLDEPQTFQGYSALLSHLSKFSKPDAIVQPEWLERISMVQGKAPLDISSREEFCDKCERLFVSCGLEKPVSILISEPLPPAEPFDNVPWNDAASDDEVLPPEQKNFREPVAILHSDVFRQFDPVQRRDLLSEAVYMKSYGLFIDRVLESFPDLERKNAEKN